MIALYDRLIEWLHLRAVARHAVRRAEAYTRATVARARKRELYKDHAFLRRWLDERDPDACAVIAELDRDISAIYVP